VNELAAMVAAEWHLLDELMLQVGSVTIDRGKPLFPHRVTSPPFRLTSVRQLGPGFAELRYEVVTGSAESTKAKGRAVGRSAAE